MTDALERAEQHIKQSEEAGLAYNTPADRSMAKLQLAEHFTKLQKQETSHTDASAAIEGGQVVGATPGGGDDAVAIAEQIEALRRGPTTQESMKERSKLTKRLGQIHDASDMTVQITAD